MIRRVLCVGLSVATLVLALCTALVQNRNRAQGLELDAIKEECSMLEAINGDRLERILERDWAPLPFSPRPPKEKKPVAPAAGRSDT